MTKLLDKIGDWNPQLYRELKGRLKPRNVWLTVAIALFMEGAIVFFCFKYRYDSLYIRWETIFPILNWTLPLFLWVTGVYLIVSDIGKEKQRETLDFIRLSPQSSQSLLLGKMLGVPILLYLGISLSLPLHFYASIQVGYPLYGIFETYALWIMVATLFYNVGLLLALSLPNRAQHYRATAALSSFLALIAARIVLASISAYLENFYDTELRWFFLSFDSQVVLTTIWFFGTLFAINTLIWQVANRHFQNPLQPLISKQQSYWIATCSQLWLLGFLIPKQSISSEESYHAVGCVFLFCAMPLLILFLSICASPNRSGLKEWMRYQRFSWRDLFLGKKSPVVGAIALNLGISSLIWIPWILLTNFAATSEFNRVQVLAGFIVTSITLLLYATLIQFVRWSAKTPRQISALSLLFVIFAGSPLILAAIGSFSPQTMPGLWLLSPVPFAGVLYSSWFAIILTFSCQLLAFAFLTQAFNKSLRSASKSELKQLLTHD